MKKLFFVLFAITILFSCEERGKIEVIPNYDMEYIEVPDYLKFTQNLISSDTKEKMNKDVTEIFSNIGKDTENKPTLYLFELFINENGTLDKVEAPVLKDNTPNKELINKMSDWKFGKYVTDGQAQKYRIGLSIMSITYSNGKNHVFVIGNDGDIIDESVYFVAVEQMPAPIGGISAIQKNVRYPEIAKRAGIEGRVFVKAYIDSTGTVAKTELLRGIGGGCDEEAMSAVKKVKFKPGLQRGKPVNVQVTVPILFKLDNTPEKEKKIKGRTEIKYNGYTDINHNGLAKLEGKIISANDGSPIVAANLIIVGTKFGCSANHLGEFFVTSIPPGEYKIIFSHPNYKKQNLGKVKLIADRSLNVEIRIKKGS